MTWNFDLGADGFVATDGVITTPNAGQIHLASSGTHTTKLASPAFVLPAVEVDTVALRVRRTAGTPTWDGGVHYKRVDDTTWSADRTVNIAEPAEWISGDWVVLRFHFKGDPNWTGTIAQIRIDLAYGSAWEADVDWVGLFASSDTATADAISALDARVTANEGALDAQASEYTALEARVDLAETGIAGHTTSINTLDARVTQTEGSITSQGAAITTLESDVTDVQGDLAGQATALEGLTTRVTSVEGNLTTESTKITSLEASVSSLNSGAPVGNLNGEQLPAGVADDPYRIQFRVDHNLPTAGVYLLLEFALQARAYAGISVTGRFAYGPNQLRMDQSMEFQISAYAYANPLLGPAATYKWRGENLTSVFRFRRFTEPDGTFTFRLYFMPPTSYKSAAADTVVSVYPTAIGSWARTAQTGPNSLGVADPGGTAVAPAYADWGYDVLTSDLEAKATAIAGLDTRVTVAEGTIVTHASQITQLNADLAIERGRITAEAAATDLIDARVTAAEGVITSHTTQITGLSSSVDDLDAGLQGEADARTLLEARVTTTETGLEATGTELSQLRVGVSQVAGAGDLIPDPTFDTWENPSKPPPEWKLAAGGWAREDADVLVGRYAVRWSVGAVASGLYYPTTAHGHYQYLTIEVTLKLVAGSLSGAGVSVLWQSASVPPQTVYQRNIAFDDHSIPSPLGKWQTITATVEAPKDPSTYVNGYSVYVHANSSAIGALAAKDLIVDRVSVRPAQDAYAAIQEEKLVRADETGALYAQYTVKTDLNGYVSGFGLASEAPVDGNPSSAFAVRADQFYVAAPELHGGTTATPPAFNSGVSYTKGDRVTYGGVVWHAIDDMPAPSPAPPGSPPTWGRAWIPFVVQTTPTVINGETIPAGVYMDSAYISYLEASKIKAGTIDADRVNAVNITAYSKMTAGELELSGGRIYSTEFDSGNQGWQIHANGNAEFWNATVRGTVMANDGYFLGTLRNVAATAFGTGIGLWSGLVSNNYRFRLGNPTGARIEWDGSAINVYGPDGTLTMSSGGIDASKVGGLGAFADLDQITVGNVSTYIANGAILDAQIGNIIQSSPYVAGSTGWRINKNGTAEFRNIVARGDIEASSLKANTLMVDTGHIKDLAVDTLKIGEHAVTVPTLSFQGAHVFFDVTSVPANGVTLASLTVQKESDEPLYLHFYGVMDQVGNTAVPIVWVYVDDVLTQTITMPAGQEGVVNIVLVNTNAAGSYSYRFDGGQGSVAPGADPGVRMVNRTIFAVETKR